MPVNNPILMSELTDEQIVAIQKRIETFAKDEEYFDKFTHKVKHQHGEKTMQVRRAIKPKVDPRTIRPSAENVAPRGRKVAVATFQHSLEIYRDKIAYTKEDILYGYDNIVELAGDTLASAFTQQLDYIKGAPFFNSKCTATVVTESGTQKILKTLDKIAIILKKNGAKRWSGGKYLCMLSPEALQKVREEIEAKGVAMTEATKAEVESGFIGSYGVWLFTECPSDAIYKSDTKQWMVCMGRREVGGASPVDVAEMDGIEVIHNQLGSGVLLDEDGNITSDDNKQKGSIAMNANGLGAYVNDDLCIIDVEIDVNLIGASELDIAEKTGYVSQSPNPLLVLAISKKADGTALTGATVVVKKGSSSGTSVNANSDGSYTVNPNSKYYYSVELATYKTVTGVVQVGFGTTTLAVQLELASA